MRTQICLFEDDYCKQLLPLVHLRPVYELRCGIVTLREKVEREYPRASVTLHCRPALENLVRYKNPGVQVNHWEGGDFLFINGRLLTDKNALKSLVPPKKGSLVYVRHEREVVAAYLEGHEMKRFSQRKGSAISLSDFQDLPAVSIEATLVSYPWDLVEQNGNQLRWDFERIRKSRRAKRRAAPKGVYMLEPAEVLLENGVVLKPGVVLDATEGPIYIGKNAVIQSHAVIAGPAAVGEGSLIKPGTHLYDGATVGPVCKIGGEVEASILQGYANKQHAGFLGHSYLCPWVNLGAGTTTSDLKNNYGSVSVFLGGTETDTKMRFVGLFMGDHSKSAINTTFNTGTVVGVSSNIFGPGFPSKSIPSFTWADLSSGYSTYALDKAIGVARTVMGRRGVELSDAEEGVLRALYDSTLQERERAGVARGR